MKSPATARSLNTAALFSLLAALGAGALAVGCQQEEAPPPLPQAKPVETPTVATIIPEDEETEEEVTTDEPKKTGKGGGGTALSKCCAALRQNAANAPPETKVQMEQAAAACDAANKAGVPSALSAIRTFGVKLPPICQ